MHCKRLPATSSDALRSQQTDQAQTVRMSDPLGQVLGSVRSIPFICMTWQSRLGFRVLESLHLTSSSDTAKLQTCTEKFAQSVSTLIKPDIDTSPVNLPLAHG